MTPVDEQPTAGNCDRCGGTIEFCAFCQKEECPYPLCYRCVRVVLGQEIPQPHDHGG